MYIYKNQVGRDSLLSLLLPDIIGVPLVGCVTESGAMSVVILNVCVCDTVPSMSGQSLV